MAIRATTQNAPIYREVVRDEQGPLERGSLIDRITTFCDRGINFTVEVTNSVLDYSAYYWRGQIDQYLAPPYNEKEWFDTIPKALGSVPKV